MKKLLFKIYYLKFFRKIEKFAYLIGGKKPWSFGYFSYRYDIIINNINHDFLKYSVVNKLPKSYGFGLDERVIEYPWLLNSLPKKAKYILDAGSILNYKFILESKQLEEKVLLISNLNPENEYYNNKSVSYLYGYYGDLRNNIIKDNIIDVVVCGSVLEHIGMNNAKVYKNSKRFNENKRYDYLEVVKEFKRVLKTNGTCLITVPFGKNRNYGWFQIFDIGMINKIIKIFGDKNSTLNFYKYFDKGWNVSNANECKNAEYFDIRKEKLSFPTGQVAAGAVACIKMIKKEI